MFGLIVNSAKSVTILW